MKVEGLRREKEEIRDINERRQPGVHKRESGALWQTRELRPGCKEAAATQLQSNLTCGMGVGGASSAGLLMPGAR